LIRSSGGDDRLEKDADDEDHGQHQWDEDGGVSVGRLGDVVADGRVPPHQ
jgi:hypothetical protein